MATRNMPSVQRNGNVLSPQFPRRERRGFVVVISARPPATVTRLKHPVRVLSVHPYHQTEE
jgi:hypothetical protein